MNINRVVGVLVLVYARVRGAPPIWIGVQWFHVVEIPTSLYCWSTGLSREASVLEQVMSSQTSLRVILGTMEMGRGSLCDDSPVSWLRISHDFC